MVDYTFDTSALIEFEHGRISLKSFPGEKAISETVLCEFCGILNEEFNLSENIQRIEEKLSFLIDNGFKLLPTLHDQIKFELLGNTNGTCPTYPIPVKIPINMFKDLHDVIMDKLGLKNFAQGENRRISKESEEELNKAMDSFLDKYENYLLNAEPLCFFIPDTNGPLLEESRDKLFNNDLEDKFEFDFNQATERVIYLLNKQPGKFHIVMVYGKNKEVITYSTENMDGVRKSYKDLSELVAKFPCTAMLLIWAYIHFHKVSSPKNGKKENLVDILKPNSAFDIDILLNSICVGKEFIFCDKLIEQYLNLLLKGKIQIEKVLSTKQHGSPFYRAYLVSQSKK